MLSIISITLALILGILWGLYLETKFLIIASIFLSFFMLMFYKKQNLIVSILSIVAILSCMYTKFNINKFDTKYLDESIQNMTITIITHLEESEYFYKYQGKNEKHDKFILYFKKKPDNIFEIGEKLKINGEYNLPDVSRNQGGFNYRRYLNSNNIYGTIKVSYFEHIPKEINIMNFIYGIQNLIHNNFKLLLPKEFARRFEWNVNWRN